MTHPLLASLSAPASVHTQSLLFQEAPKLQVDDDLPALVSAADGRCLPYVALEGKEILWPHTRDKHCALLLYPWCISWSLGIVLPAKAVLNSHYHEGLQGVIQKLLVKEHRLIWNSLARNW